MAANPQSRWLSIKRGGLAGACVVTRRIWNSSCRITCSGGYLVKASPPRKISLVGKSCRLKKMWYSGHFGGNDPSQVGQNWVWVGKTRNDELHHRVVAHIGYTEEPKLNQHST